MAKNALPFLESLYEHLELLLHEPELRYLDVQRLMHLTAQVKYAANEWMVNWAVEHPRCTNWDLIPDRTRRDYEGMKFHGQPNCTTCGADISTEALFWQHYIIPDISTPNLGHCPTKE